MQNEIELRERGKEALFKALEAGCQMVLKLRKLDAEWKSIMMRLVEDTIRDYSRMEEYTKERLNEVELSQ